MCAKKFVTAVCLMVIAATGVFLGCEGDPGPIGPQGIQGPSGPSELNIQAVLRVANIEVKAAQQGTFAMSVYNAASIPSVTLNDTIVRPDEGWLIDEGRLAYSADIGLIDVSSANLRLTFTKRDGNAGTAASVISLPNAFSAVNPDITLPEGDSVKASWSRSSGADAYWIYFAFTFDYLDTADTPRQKFFELDTVLVANDTTLDIAGAAIFPDMAIIGSVTSYGGDLFVTAVSGPWLPGEADNISGDAFGYFVGIGDQIEIQVRQPTTKADGEPGDAIRADQSYIETLLGRRIDQLAR